jgi:excisionase family DNA binding protein
LLAGFVGRNASNASVRRWQLLREMGEMQNTTISGEAPPQRAGRGGLSVDDDFSTTLRACLAPLISTLEAKIETLHALLTRKRKDHFVVEEVAKLTGRSPFTIRRWIKENKLQAIRLQGGGPRGRLLIARSELEKLIAAGSGKSVSEIVLG